MRLWGVGCLSVLAWAAWASRSVGVQVTMSGHVGAGTRGSRRRLRLMLSSRSRPGRTPNRPLSLSRASRMSSVLGGWGERHGSLLLGDWWSAAVRRQDVSVRRRSSCVEMSSRSSLVDASNLIDLL